MSDALSSYVPAPFTRHLPREHLVMATETITANTLHLGGSIQVENSNKRKKGVGGRSSRLGFVYESGAHKMGLDLSEGVLTRAVRWYDWLCYRLAAKKAAQPINTFRAMHGLPHIGGGLPTSSEFARRSLFDAAPCSASDRLAPCHDLLAALNKRQD